MTDRIALDSSPLSLAAHPNEREPRVKEVRDWLEAQLAAGAVVFLPEITDYEVRRELLRLQRQRSIGCLGMGKAIPAIRPGAATPYTFRTRSS